MNVGDVVILKSGGPKMVIKEDQGTNEYGRWFTCRYFDDNNLAHTLDCQESELVLADQQNDVN